MTGDARVSPSWLVEPESATCPCCSVSPRRRGGFAAKTLASVASTLRRAMQSEELASRPGFLQRLDPRAKLVVTVGALLAASLVHAPLLLLGLWIAVVVLAAASGVGATRFVARQLPVLAFTSVVVGPAAFRVGGVAAAVIVLRVIASTSLVALLMSTTRWNDVLHSLRWARVPGVFVAVLAMAYRYVFHLLDSVTDMYQAQVARTVRRGDHRGDRGFVSASAGVMFGKAHELSSEVHMAMVSRGYSGR